MLPKSSEIKEYFFSHPIAGTFIAFAAAEAIKTVYESLINPKGQSPFSSYTDIRSGDILDDLGHLSKSQASELDEISSQLRAASKKHAGQADRIKQLGSTSTTTSTSSAHGGNEREPTGSTWDKLKMPGERPQMFGGPKKGSVLMGPPSMRRRISLNSITLGGHAHAPQKLNQEREQLGTSSHFGMMMNMMPEQSADATDNPLV
jgi:hypothetical protein